MIRIRPHHFLHPISSVKSLYFVLTANAVKRQAERKIGLRRGKCNQCWCGGSLRPFEWHSSYGVCTQCGCYVNRRPPLPDELAKLYAFENYWHYRQQLKGYPTIENRSLQDQTDGRLYRWLDLVEKHGRLKGRVIEIGCAHGTLLAELKQRGYECLGVEVDEESAAWTRKHTGVEVRAGIFPGVALPDCDVFMAFDVIEHSLHPDQFMREAVRLLAPGGVAIIQTPVDRHETARPFLEWFTPVFDDVEHLFLFTVESIHKLAAVAGLEIIEEAHGVLGIDVTVFRKPV